jgi:hypothetical protein
VSPSRTYRDGYLLFDWVGQCSESKGSAGITAFVHVLGFEPVAQRWPSGEDGPGSPAGRRLRSVITPSDGSKSISSMT